MKIEDYNGFAIRKTWKRVLGLVIAEPSRFVVVFSEGDLGKRREIIRSDLKERKFNLDLAKDKNAWMSVIKNRATRTSMEAWKTYVKMNIMIY